MVARKFVNIACIIIDFEIKKKKMYFKLKYNKYIYKEKVNMYNGV